MEEEELNDDLIGSSFPADDDDLLLDDELDTPLKFDEEEEDPEDRFH